MKNIYSLGGLSMEQVLVSVIVPIYKVEGCLKICIESILNQTYSNLEIILVDDGSPDNCGQICDEYAIKDFRIQVIHKENGGLSDARNAGIEVATGEYLVFIDSDDSIHPQMIELLIKPILAGKAQLSVCDFNPITEPEVTNTSFINNEKCVYIHSLADRHKYYFEEEKIVTFVVAWNKMYPAYFFKNIRYPKGKIHEDEFTTYKLLDRADTICYIEHPLYNYLSRQNSIMKESFSEKNLSKFDAYEERMDYYYQRNDYYSLEKILNLYRLYFRNLARHTIFQNELSVEYFKKYSSHYKKIIKKYVIVLPVPLKKKLGYMAFAICPKLYIKRKLNF